MKKLKSIKKINVLWIPVLILIILILLSFFIRPKTFSVKTIEVENLEGIILDNETTITQTLKSNDNYSSIGFLASSNSNYINKGKINVTIIQDGKVKKKYKIQASKICDDNYYYKYYYVKYNFKKNKNYTINITANNLSDNVLIGKTSYKSDDLSLMKDNILQEGNIALSFMYKTDNKFYTWYYLMIASLLITYIIIPKMKGRKHEKK